MAPWFSEAIQEVGRRGAGWQGLRAKVGETVRGIAARTAQLEETVTNSLVQTLQGSYSASEVEVRLESDAKNLRHAGNGAEVLHRWIGLLRASPQPKYTEPAATADDFTVLRPSQQYTFKQVFLRSRALECALDAAVRAPELRMCLREHALPPPDVWPEERPPPLAFAHAFVALLRMTVGPPSNWLGILAALLSSDEGVKDEQCHAWLVQLLCGQRLGWEDASVRDREREVEALEEAASLCVAGGGRGDDVESGSAQSRATSSGGSTPGKVEASPKNLQTLLVSLARRGHAASTAYRAWGLRRELADELGLAAANRERQAKEFGRGPAAAVAAAASEWAAGLDAELTRQNSSSLEARGDLGERAAEMRGQLASLDPVSQQLQREIEETEITQRELLRQVGQLSEKLDMLRRQKAEAESQREQVRTDLQRIEGDIAETVASDDEGQRRAHLARALATTVVDLAEGISRRANDDAASSSSSTTPATFHDEVASALAADAGRSRAVAAAVALELGEREAERLRLVIQAAQVCSEVAEERERSREAMEKLGVPVMTLESDVVGEAEIAQSIHDALVELDRCRPDVEALRRELASGDNIGGSQTASARAGQLAEELGDGLDECRALRKRLKSLESDVETDLSVGSDFLGSVPGGIVEIDGQVTVHAEGSSADPFYLVSNAAASSFGSSSSSASASSPRGAGVGGRAGGVSGVRGFFAPLARAVGRGGSRDGAAASGAAGETVIADGAELDPFLLAGTEGDQTTSAVAAAAQAAEPAVAAGVSPACETAAAMGAETSQTQPKPDQTPPHRQQQPAQKLAPQVQETVQQQQHEQEVPESMEPNGQAHSPPQCLARASSETQAPALQPEIQHPPETQRREAAQAQPAETPEQVTVRNLDTGEELVIKNLDTGEVHKLPPS